MTLLCFRNLLAGSLLVVAACDADSSRDPSDGWTSDAGIGGDASVPTAADRVANLSLLGALTTSGLTLVPGEVVTVKVRLADLFGDPVVEARAEISLLGQSLNATASVLVDYSNEEGVVSFFVQAGSVPTSFQLRITSGSQDAYIPITVASTSSADVEFTVEPPYQATVTGATLRAYANRTCATLGTAEPASAMVRMDPTMLAVSATLYAEATYAVTLDLETSEAGTLRGCVDGITSGSASTEIDLTP